MPLVEVLLVVAAAWLVLDVAILAAVLYFRKRRERDLSRTTQ